MRARLVVAVAWSLVLVAGVGVFYLYNVLWEPDPRPRQAARGELFKKVDSSKRGKIGIDDWIQYALSTSGRR